MGNVLNKLCQLWDITEKLLLSNHVVLTRAVFTPFLEQALIPLLLRTFISYFSCLTSQRTCLIFRLFFKEELRLIINLELLQPFLDEPAPVRPVDAVFQVFSNHRLPHVFELLEEPVFINRHDNDILLHRHEQIRAKALQDLADPSSDERH